MFGFQRGSEEMTSISLPGGATLGTEKRTFNSTGR
jgi:hypothetical protein